MNKTLLLFLFLVATGLLMASAPKEITVAAGETRTAAVNAFNAHLDISGKIDESIFLLGGHLRLQGEVTGDVICIAAKVEIGEKAVIGRDLIVMGGNFRRAETSRVGGTVYDVRSREDLKQIAASILPFIPDSGGMTFFRVIKIFFWLILSLLTLTVFPVQVAQAAAMLPQKPLHHLGRGLAALLLFLLLMLVFLLLSFILIGIPLLIVLMAAYVLLLIFGRSTVFYFVGNHACRSLKLKASPALLIVVGVAVYTLFKFIPFAGVALLIIMDLFALGIAVGFFIRRRKSFS